MMTHRCLHPIGLAVAAVMVLLTGCRSSTPPVEFYTLSPQSPVSAARKIAEPESGIAVGLGPLQIPKFIDRPQIVTRTGTHKINVDEFHRWAGSVYEDILRALTLNLAALLQSNLVMAYPWEDYFDPEYRVYLEVHAFDGRLGQYAQLDVTWTITGRESRNLLLVRKSLIREPTRGDDYDALVAAKSRILGALSRQLAQGIAAVHRGEKSND